MPPNFVDPPFEPEAAIPVESKHVKFEKGKEGNYALRVFRGCLNNLAHLLIGVVVSVTLWYSLRNIPLSSTMQHILLCTTGYHFLMAEAILCFSSGNGWSIPLKLKHKKLFHWILQILGSVLALSGSLIIITSGNGLQLATTHGKLGFSAMIFTLASLVNGVSSLYAYELRKFLPQKMSKITHICFGIVAFVLASACLCMGFDKNGFRNWASNRVASTLMAFTFIYTVVIVIDPLISLWMKLSKS